MKNIKTVLPKLLTGLFSLAFLTITGILIYSALQPEKLPIGAPMPKMKYLTKNGSQLLLADSARVTMVVYFHTSCKSCRSQLYTLNNNIEKFKKINMIMLTYEKDFLQQDKVNAWPNLAQAKNVTWGMASYNVIYEHFAPRMSPMTYIFDRTSLLTSKIRGEAKLGKIIKELKKTGGPERRFSNK